MRIECPNCKFAGNAPDDKAGVIATCPKCRTKFQVSHVPPPEPAPELQPTINCPKCGIAQDESDTCISCGLVFSKFNKAQEQKEHPPIIEHVSIPPPPEEENEKTGNTSRPYLTIALVVFCVWFFFTPHLAVHNMKAAAEERNAPKLSSYVNYPALKESLKTAFNAKLAAEVSKEHETNPLAVLGAAMAAAFINPMIDMLVTPESLAMIMKGDNPQLGKNSKTQPPKTDADIKTSSSYESVNRFVVTIREKSKPLEHVQLVFNREGLFSWKLSEIRFPI